MEPSATVSSRVSSGEVDLIRGTRVCVIGAGPAGLAAAKEFLQAGMSVDVYEKQPHLGGLWNLDVDAPGVTANTRATSSKAYLQFSDYPMAESAPHFVHYTEYLAYLDDYARHFDLSSRIHYQTEVARVQRGGNSWRVTLRSHGEETQRVFDRVAVCSGLHQHAKELDVPGIEHVRDRIIHSSRVKYLDQFDGKRVLVIGAGESGADLAHDISQKTSAAFIAVRRGVAVLPRWHRKGQEAFPSDYGACRACYWLPRPFLHDFFTPAQGSAFGSFFHLLCAPVILFLALVSPKTHWPVLRQMLAWSFYKPLFAKRQRHGPPSGLELSRACAEIVRDTTVDVGEKAARLRVCFEWFSGLMHGNQPFTKSPYFLEDIALGKLRVMPMVKAFSAPKTAVFEDGTTLDFDWIVACTGYESRVRFLDEPTLDGRQLYLNVFSPRHPGLAFIGFARPSIGAMPPLAEMQARWVSCVWRGLCSLPSDDEMRQSVAEAAASYDNLLPLHRQRLTSQVDYHKYLNDLAVRIGCRPRLWRLVVRPLLFLEVLLGPYASWQFRLHGHGANWKAAHEAMARIKSRRYLSIAAVLHLYLYFAFRPLFWLLSRVFRSATFRASY